MLLQSGGTQKHTKNQNNVLSWFPNLEILSKNFFKGSVSRDFRPQFCFWFKPIWAPYKQAKVFSNPVSLSPRYWFYYKVISVVGSTLLRSKHFLNKSTFILQICYFLIDVFPPKRISPGCLFKSNQRQVKNSILFPWCAIYLCSVLLTTEIVSAVCCTPLRWFLRYAAHRGNPLYGVLHTAVSLCTEIISKVWCTTRRWSSRYVAHSGDHFETEFENTLGCLSEAQMGSNHEKNRGQKFRDTLPLKNKEQI